jgi:predicted transcriptional regulator
MTPQQYRSDYGLPDSYSMVSAEYAQMRRDMANSIGLGRKKSDSVKAPASAQDETPPKRRGLSKKAEATTSPA